MELQTTLEDTVLRFYERIIVISQSQNYPNNYKEGIDPDYLSPLIPCIFF